MRFKVKVAETEVATHISEGSAQRAARSDPRSLAPKLCSNSSPAMLCRATRSPDWDISNYIKQLLGPQLTRADCLLRDDEESSHAKKGDSLIFFE